MNAVAVAMEAIETAGLTDKQYRAARRLLDRCYETGHLTLTHEAAHDIITTTTEGATRRLLGQLKAAGIIRYRVNGYVYVNFTAYGPDDDDEPRAESDHDEAPDDPEPRSLSDHPRAESDHPRAESDHDEAPADPEPRSLSDHPRALSDHPRAESDHPRAGNARNCFPTYTHARGRVGWLVGITPSSNGSDPNQPTPAPNERVSDPVAQAIAFGLLKSAGIAPLNAKELSDRHDLETIRRAVGYWWDNRDGMFRSPGIVVTWLRNPDAAGVPDCSAAFMRSPLYRQWRTKAEIVAEQEAEAAALARLRVAGAQRRPDQAEEAPQGPLDLLWAEILQGYALSDLPTFEQWLSATKLVELTEELALITAPARKVEYVQSRLVNGIRRELAMRGHRPGVITIQEVDHGS